MKTITATELKKILAGIRSATFATLTLHTTPSNMRKTDNPYYDTVKKVSIYNVCLNFNYEKSVNRQRVREDEKADFKAQERSWGEHETAAIVEKDGKYYLQAKLEKVIATRFLNAGKPIEEELLKPFMRENKGNAKQELDKEVIVISPKFENIKAISINGTDYVIAA